MTRDPLASDFLCAFIGMETARHGAASMGFKRCSAFDEAINNLLEVFEVEAKDGFALGATSAQMAG